MSFYDIIYARIPAYERNVVEHAIQKGIADALGPGIQVGRIFDPATRQRDRREVVLAWSAGEALRRRETHAEEAEELATLIQQKMIEALTKAGKL